MPDILHIHVNTGTSKATNTLRAHQAHAHTPPEHFTHRPSDMQIPSQNTPHARQRVHQCRRNTEDTRLCACHILTYTPMCVPHTHIHAHILTYAPMYVHILTYAPMHVPHTSLEGAHSMTCTPFRARTGPKPGAHRPCRYAERPGSNCPY